MTNTLYVSASGAIHVGAGETLVLEHDLCLMGTLYKRGEGTLVLAAMDGVVTAARRSATYGNYLCLSHSGGQETLYAHLQYLFVRAGEVVQAGQPLGTAGETGRSTGAHLHFELLEQGVRYDAGALLGLP